MSRPTETYRGARRNSNKGGDWQGIAPGAYPRKSHNAAKLKAPTTGHVPAPLNPLLLALMHSGGMIRAVETT